jgi:hypothetical protein
MPKTITTINREIYFFPIILIEKCNFNCICKLLWTFWMTGICKYVLIYRQDLSPFYGNSFISWLFFNNSLKTLLVI